MPNPFVDFVDDQQAENGVKGIIDTARIQSSVDDVFDFSTSELEPDDVEVTERPGGKGVQQSDSITDSESEIFREKASESDAFSFQRRQEYWRADVSELPAPDPRDVTQRRSADELAQDRDEKARVTTDVDRYAADPNSFDFPFVDTPPEFNDEFSRSTLGGTRIEGESVFEESGDDDIFTF